MANALPANDLVTNLISMIIPVGQKEIDAIFNTGVQLYKSTRYEDASRFFLFICIVRPFDARYLSAFGKARKMMNDFQLASVAFQAAFLMDRDSKEHAVHAAECLLRTGKKEEARCLLEVAAQDAVLLAYHPRIHEKASAWLEFISFNNGNGQ